MGEYGCTTLRSSSRTRCDTIKTQCRRWRSLMLGKTFASSIVGNRMTQTTTKIKRAPTVTMLVSS